MIRNIIFDWSGTLVNDLPAVWQATNQVLERSGHQRLSLEQFRSRFQLPLSEFYGALKFSVSTQQLESWFFEKFEALEAGVEALPQALPFLKFCQEHGLRTFVLSSVPEKFYRPQAERMGLSRFIEKPYVGVQDKRQVIGELIAQQGLNRDETLFIGDMRHDIETAQHGGIHSCGVLTGYQRSDQLLACRPTLLVEHLGELKILLERHQFRLIPEVGEGSTAPPRRPISTVGALIRNELGEVLLVRTQKWSGLWGIPGGKINYGERAEEALRREIREETNLDLESTEFVMVQDCIGSKEFYREEHFLLLNYVALCGSDHEVILNQEAEEFQWIGMPEALELLLNRPTRILIEEVIRREQEALTVD